MPLAPKPPKPRASLPGALIPGGNPKVWLLPGPPPKADPPFAPPPPAMRSRRASSSLACARPPLVLPFTSNESSASAPKPAPGLPDAAFAAASASACWPSSVALTRAFWNPGPAAGFGALPGPLPSPLPGPPRGPLRYLPEPGARVDACAVRGISRVQCLATGWLPTVTCSSTVVNPNISTWMFHTPGPRSKV